jgi:hypothetical protein
MPELHLKDIRKDLRWPELRLPEMSRDDIAKALGEARKEMSEMRRDLNEFRREMEMPKVDLAKVELPKIDLAKVDKEARAAAKDARKAARKAGKQVTKEMTKAAQDAGIVKRPSRLPFVILAAITLALVGWALATPTLRERVKTAAQGARDRMAERDTEGWGSEPAAFDTGMERPFGEPPVTKPEAIGDTNGKHAIKEDAPARA